MKDVYQSAGLPTGRGTTARGCGAAVMATDRHRPRLRGERCGIRAVTGPTLSVTTLSTVVFPRYDVLR